MRSIKTLAILAALALTSSTLRAAEEWPQWRGPKGDGIVSADGLAAKWPAEGPKKVWEANVGIGYASPVGLDGKVYLFHLEEPNKETLTAYDAASGKPAWAQSYMIGKGPDYPGVRATPTIDSGKIYTYGATGVLVCRNLADGNEVWKLDILKETGATMLGSGGIWGQASSPVIVGNALYVQGGVGGPAVLAVDKASGKFIWKSEAAGPGGYGSVILIDVGGKPQLIALAGQAIYGINPADGKTIWNYPWKTSYDVNAATPIYRDGKLFISSGYNHGSVMLDLAAGTAKKLWEKKEVQCKFQPPILDGDTLYAVTEAKRGIVVAMKWPTGEIAWEFKSPQFGFGGSIVRVGKDKLIGMTQTGTLVLLQATPQKAELISEAKPFGDDDSYKEVWATPLVYQGKLFAKGKDKFVCLDISGK